MSADPTFPPPVVPPAIRPSLSTGFDVPLSFLWASEVDISVVVGNVQTALLQSVNDAPSGEAITLASLRETVSDVDGVARCRYVYADGDDADLPASASGYLIDVPAMVDAGDCRILQA